MCSRPDTHLWSRIATVPEHTTAWAKQSCGCPGVEKPWADPHRRRLWRRTHRGRRHGPPVDPPNKMLGRAPDPRELMAARSIARRCHSDESGVWD